MDLKTTCTYCSTKNTITVELKNLVPQLVRCANNACQKLYLVVPKLVSKEYGIILGNDTV